MWGMVRSAVRLFRIVVFDSGFQPSDRVAVRRFSHRRVGGGGCKASSRMAYAFGMVMYWVCAGWLAVG